MPKIVALTGGCHYDRTCDHFVLPDGVDLGAIRAEHERWFKEKYLPSLKPGAPKVEITSFRDRLILAGARKTTHDELEEVEG